MGEDLRVWKQKVCCRLGLLCKQRPVPKQVSRTDCLKENKKGSEIEGDCMHLLFISTISNQLRSAFQAD